MGNVITGEEPSRTQRRLVPTPCLSEVVCIRNISVTQPEGSSGDQNFLLRKDHLLC